MLDISVHGDTLEKCYASFIRINIPAYEQIWMRYIGNDGSANMIDLPSLNTEEKKRRKLFSQYHYSLLESLVCLKRIVETKLSFSSDKFEEYLDLMNNFFAFQAHAGRIRDCIRKMGEQFRMRDLHVKLEEFYQQRNTSLHGCKIPFKIVNGLVNIPQIKGADEDSSRWHDKLTWDEAIKLSYKPMNDYMSDTFNQMIPVVNQCLSQLLDRIKEFVAHKNIDYKLFVQPFDLGVTAVSGCSFSPLNNAILDRVCDSSSCVNTDIKIVARKKKRKK